MIECVKRFKVNEISNKFCYICNAEQFVTI